MSTMLEYFLKLRNSPKFRRWGSKSGQNRVKFRYCPKLGAATLISDTEVFLKKGPKRPKNVIFNDLGP
jgi:hypothetical protein